MTIKELQNDRFEKFLNDPNENYFEFDENIYITWISSDDDGDDIAIPAVAASAEALDFNAQKEAFEKEFIIKALKTFKGRINQTALHANIQKKTLLRKIEKYGINAKEFSL